MTTLDIEFLSPRDRAADLARRVLAGRPPALPTAPDLATARRHAASGWSPPGTRLLQRFVNPATMRYAAFTQAPEHGGWVSDRTLGLVHVVAQPGTRRLVARGDRHELTDDEYELRDERRAIGFVETAALPMLRAIERRRLRATGQEILVVGTEDPLFEASDAIEHLGWVEPFPIDPSPALSPGGRWGWSLLFREVEAQRWRHRYSVSDGSPSEQAVCLGRVALRGVRGGAALGPDGMPVARASAPAPAGPAADARWALAPLRWGRGLGEPSLAMVRRRAAWLRARPPAEPPGAPVFHLLAPSDPRGEPLFAAAHPQTGDAYLSRSPFEAADMGYLPLGIAGRSQVAEEEAPALFPDVPWGSRLGRGRRSADPAG